MTHLKINPPWHEVGDHHAIVTGAPGEYFAQAYTLPLSLKSVTAGAAHYRVEGQVRTLRSNDLLIVNQGQEYDLSIRPEDHTRTLCVFFAHGFIEGALLTARAMATNADLVEENHGSGAALQFPD